MKWNQAKYYWLYIILAWVTFWAFGFLISISGIVSNVSKDGHVVLVEDGDSNTAWEPAGDEMRKRFKQTGFTTAVWVGIFGLIAWASKRKKEYECQEVLTMIDKAIDENRISQSKGTRLFRGYYNEYHSKAEVIRILEGRGFED